MNFIIFDLEWNNAYNYKLKRGMNEIIEIGAVKLDENLDVVDTFKQLIKPQLSRKLGQGLKILHILLLMKLTITEYRLKKPLTILQNGAAGGTNCF